MNRLWLIPVVLVALLVPTAAVLASNGERGFDGVVSSIEGRYHVHATRVPFMGVLSLISRKASHGGVAGIHVAEFEHFSEPIDGEELNRMVEEKLGPGWERMIRETSHCGKAQTLIFVHPEGTRMGMFIVDRDGNQMDVVQVSVDPDHLNESIARYDHSRSDHDDNQDGSGESN